MLMTDSLSSICLPIPFEAEGMIRLNHPHSLSRGFTIIETLVCACILISLMSLGSRYITQNAERTVNQITAQQLQHVTQAAQQYVQDHYPMFKENLNQTLTWQDLVNGGYLSDKSLEKNHYGQAYRFTLLEEKGLLQILLTTEEGHSINENSLRQIVALAGSSAGYASILHQDNIVGHQESWFLKTSLLKTGHLASLTIVNEKEVMNVASFLRRTKLIDHPEHNRMDTPLEMAEGTHISYGNNGSRLSRNDFYIDSDDKSYISVSGGGNKFFKISYPNSTGGTMELWGDILLLQNNKNIFSLENRQKTELNIIKNGFLSQLNEEKIYFKNNINNSTSMTAESIRVDRINPSDYSGWNLNMNTSRFRTQIDGTGVRVPYYLFNDTPKADFQKFGQYVCGSRPGNFSDEDGKLFVLAQNSQESHLYICLTGFAYRLLHTFNDP